MDRRKFIKATGITSVLGITTNVISSPVNTEQKIKWISCKERFPEYNKPYLVYVKNKNIERHSWNETEGIFLGILEFTEDKEGFNSPGYESIPVWRILLRFDSYKVNFVVAEIGNSMKKYKGTDTDSFDKITHWAELPSLNTPSGEIEKIQENMDCTDR